MSTPSFAAVLRQLVDARLVDVHTSLPGRVVSYDATTQRASVKPLLKRGRRDEAGERVAGAAVAALQPHDAGASSHLGFEFDDRLDAILAGTLDIARRVAIGIDGEFAGAGLCGGLDKTLRDRQPVADRLDGPGKRNDIAPLAIGPEQHRHTLRVVRSQGRIQAIEPATDDQFRISVQFDVHNSEPVE